MLKSRRLAYHSTLSLGVIKKRKKDQTCAARESGCGSRDAVQSGSLYIKAVVTLSSQSVVAIFNKGVMNNIVVCPFRKRGVTLSRVCAGTRTRPGRISTRSIPNHLLFVSRVG